MTPPITMIGMSGPVSKLAAIQPVPFDDFPVSNAALEWVMSAQDGPDTFTSGTSHDLSDTRSTVYSGDWTSSQTMTRSSYTNSSGDTRYYYYLPNGSNLRTSSNTSSNSDVSSNGFTFYISMIPYSSGTTWVRPWNYYGLANGSTTTVAGNTDEYDGPLFFMNRGRTDLQYRRPPNNNSNGDYAYTASGSVAYGTDRTFSIVIQQSTNGNAKYWLRGKAWSGTVYDTIDATSFSFAGAGGYGIRSGTNTAVPVFADAYYNFANHNGIMESGFGNKAYTDSECEDLVDYLNNKYA